MTAKASNVVALARPPEAEDEWPAYALVPLDQLTVDVYQRPLTSFVRKIEKQYDPALIGTISLSQRSETLFAIMDGQTRAEGMRRIGKLVVPSLIHVGLTRKEEAKLFIRFQRERRAPTTVGSFNAELIAEEPFALELNEIVDSLGFTISTGSGPECLRAVGSLAWILRGCTSRASATDTYPRLLATTLEMVKLAWPTMPKTATNRVILKGLATYLHRVDLDRLDQDRLVRRLARFQAPSQLADRANDLRRGRSMPGNATPEDMADAIEEMYNRTR